MRPQSPNASMSLARSSSATRFFSDRTSSESAARDTADGALMPSARSASSTQFRNVAGFRSNNDPTCRRAPTLESPPSAKRSRYIRTARSTNSRSYFFGAPMRKVSLARCTDRTGWLRECDSSL